MPLTFNGSGYGLIINQGVTLTTNLTLSGSGAGLTVTAPLAFYGVVSGSGNVTNSRVMNTWYPSLVVTNGNNSFVGNWVNLVNDAGVSFANDGAIGASGNSIILDNGALLVTSTAFTLGSGHSLVIGSGGGKIGKNASGSALTLANANTLLGSGLLTVGQYGSLAVNASQPNFTGQVSVVGTSSGLTLGGSNGLGNATGISVGASGTLALNHPYGAGSSTVTNLAYGLITLGTNLIASGGTRVYLSDLSMISGTEARLGFLDSPGNVTIAPGAIPMVVHPAVADGIGISGVDKTNLVYGSTGNATASRMIGDAASGQWRGIGAGGADYVYNTPGTLTLNGNAALDATPGKNLYVYGLINGGSAANTLDIRGGGTVWLNNVSNNFANLIYGAGGTTLSAGHTSNTMTFKFAAVSNNFSGINNSTGTLVLDGAGSTNVVSGTIVGTTGGTLVFSNGFYSLAGLSSGVGQCGGLTVAGANIVFMSASGRLGFAHYADAGPVNITSGSLVVTNTQYTFRMGAANGASAGGNFNSTVNQSGGSVFVYFGSGSNVRSIEMGGTASSRTNAYYMSGGLMNLAASSSGSIWLGAATDGTALTQFSITGGKLIAVGKIEGVQVAPARQVFDFSGGTLAAFTVDATKLASTNAPTVHGTLVNNGGTLAPGDIGTAGKTTVTGNYTETSPNAVMALDIGGTTQGSAFQTGTYDYLNIVTGTATFAGRLSVRLINGYAPPNTKTNFTVVAVTGTSPVLAGAFANVMDNKVWCADGYSRFDVLFNTTAKTVILSNYVANAWSQAAGGSWMDTANWTLATEPSNSDYAAYFGANLASSGTVTLDTARTVRGLTFANSAASYTISGAALTLQGDTVTTPRIAVLSGSHTISVSMALSNATEIAVAGSSVLTLTGGITGGQDVTKTGTGLLVLSGGNTLGALTISAGTLRLEAGTTTVTSFTLASGATVDFVTGALVILKNSGGIDTLDEINAAITANAFTLRGKNAVPAEFNVKDEGSTIKVTAKVKGTLIRFM
jgi:fibronectin-binding autotransporter adhesin